MKRKEPEKAKVGCAENNDGNVSPNGGESENSSNSDTKEGSTFKLDYTILDCPICFEPFKLPLTQCINGHVICSQCCNLLKKKCPMCNLSLLAFRCLPFESIIESIMVSCPYQRFGCDKSLPYNMKHGHKNDCLYAPCFCPVLACGFNAPIKSFSSHFDTRHRSFDQQRMFTLGKPFELLLPKEQPFYILRAKGDLHFLLLNNVGALGNSLSIVRLMPDTASADFYYKLIVERSPIQNLTLKDSIMNARKLTVGYMPDVVLYVPKIMFGTPAFISVKVCIKV